MTDQFDNPGAPSSSCERRFDIAVYLLGGLSEVESRAVRAHIDSCESCTVELRSLRPVTDLVAAAGARALRDDLAGSEPEPDLGRRIIDRAAAELGSSDVPIDLTVPRPSVSLGRPARARGRWMSIAAASMLFVLGGASVLGAQRLLEPDRPAPVGQSVRFATVSLRAGATSSPDDPARPRAWAWVGETPAGTYATLYTRHLQPGQTYRWWFERRDGSRVPLGSFTYPPTQETWLVCPGSTSEPRASLVAIGATDSTGHEVLRTVLPPPQLRRI